MATIAEIQVEVATLMGIPGTVPSDKKFLARMGGLKLGQTCGRCGGSGNYSFNQIDGTRCYGCGGSGQVLPKTKVEWEMTLAAAKTKRENGEFDAYMAHLDRKARAKQLVAPLRALWKAAHDTIRYSALHDVERRQPRDTPRSADFEWAWERARKLNEFYEELGKTEHNIKFGGIFVARGEPRQEIDWAATLARFLEIQTQMEAIKQEGIDKFGPVEG